MARKAHDPPPDENPWPIAEGLRTSGGPMTLPEMVDRLARALAPPPSRARLRGRRGPPAPPREAAAWRVEPRDWIEQLLDRLQVLPPAAFERLCQRMLREKGFARVEVTGKSGDGGIDGLGVLRLNLLSFPVLFQCKRYRGQVGSGVVRDFRGAMVGRAEKGLIITTGCFTRDARREAVRDGAPPVDLIDGPALCHILKELRLGVGVTMVENVTILEADLAAL